MSMIDEIRRQAMSEDGISAEDMAGYQQRQANLQKIAEMQGGAEAIRAAVRPKATSKPGIRENGRVASAARAPIRENGRVASAARAPIRENGRVASAGRTMAPDSEYVKAMLARDMGAEEALAAQNAVGMDAAMARMQGDVRRSEPASSGPDMPVGMAPDPEWLVQQLMASAAQAPATAESAGPEQGIVAKLMQLRSGGQQAAPSTPWQGPKGMQGALPAAMNPGARLMGR